MHATGLKQRFSIAPASTAQPSTTRPPPPPTPPKATGSSLSPLTDSLQRLHATSVSIAQRTPEAVKQFAAAARSGNLFRVAGIQAQNTWLRFGTLLVAVGCAGASYAVWRSVESVVSIFVSIRENHFALAGAVRSSTPQLALLTSAAAKQALVWLRDCRKESQTFPEKRSALDLIVCNNNHCRAYMSS
jgi:hypothetical protein